jgi:hypothetical protein
MYFCVIFLYVGHIRGLKLKKTHSLSETLWGLGTLGLSTAPVETVRGEIVMVETGIRQVCILYMCIQHTQALTLALNRWY